MTDAATLSFPAVTHQRAKGAVVLETRARANGRSYASIIRQESSFRVLFPHGTRKSVEAVLLNTAGGITGGDRFAVTATAQPGSAMTITTQAAERVYRAVGTSPGTVTTALKVAPTARINWLPQETILFDGSALDRTLTVDLDKGASFLMAEPLVFGRTASGEVVSTGHLQDRVSIRRAGQLIYRDHVHLTGPLHDILLRPALANGGLAAASVVFAAPYAAAQLDTIRDMLPETAGASLLADDLLVMRVVAEDSFVLRKTLIPVLNHLTENALPKTWRL